VKIRIWGCRGSLASPGPDTVRYGGNTSSVEVRLDDGSLIVLDAGTGIRELGRHLAKSEPVKKINLFLSHLHLDHVEGIGFFSAIWDPDVELHVWGPPSPLRSLQDRIATLMSPPLFPVHLADVPCRPIYHDVPEEELKIGNATVYVQPVAHRGSTVGYRIGRSGTSRTTNRLSASISRRSSRSGSPGSPSRRESTSCFTTRSTPRRSIRPTARGDTRASPTPSPSVR
jgi:phosphoribosyl 1,2-cyclic phosphodiesterase